MRREWRIGRLGPVLRGGSALLAAAVALCVSAGSGSAARHPPQVGLDRITLQLRSASQAEFAGYFAAKSLGFYEDFGLHVDFRPGRPGVTPEQVVAGGRAQIGLDWLPALLAARDTGSDLVNIAQVFARSGMTEVAWRSSAITSIGGLKDRKVGVWCCGYQLELYAALKKYGIDAVSGQGIRIVNQAFNMNAFLHHRIDAAAALTYNELAKVLETRNPRTGRLYTLRDLTVFKLQDLGTGMLEDGLFAKRNWLGANRDVAMRFVAATDRGWIYCRAHVDECTSIVLRYGPRLRRDHQRWQMNEVNKLIWPSPQGIGVMDAAAFKRTSAIALQYKLIKSRATAKAYDAPLAAEALRFLRSRIRTIGVSGTSYMPVAVTLGPSGR